MPNPITSAENIKDQSLKHSFYLSGFAKCSRCPYFKYCNDCPKLNQMIIDNVSHCSYEKEFFDKTKKTIERDFELKPTDLVIIDSMIHKMILVMRARKYISDAGVTIQTPDFNPKTGDEHWMDTPNPLLKPLYYMERDVREWLDNMNLSRKGRESDVKKIDIALELTKHFKISKEEKILIEHRNITEGMENEDSE
jgi:hypothetical protein